jgi:hypothetical protein
MPTPAFLLGLLGLLVSSAQAEPVETIRDHGDPANRLDLAVVGDGYTEEELELYASDVERVVSSFFSEEPFLEYQSYFNVHRVDVISNESGADHPERDEFRDTALDATYNCSGIQRLICVDRNRVWNALLRSLAPNQLDMILVIVNDPEYGGSGGEFAVASTDAAVTELVLHEVGHSFGGLADEYEDSPPVCRNTLEPSEPNVTRQTQRDLIKWNVLGGPPTGWIEFATPIPTATSSPGTPGLYEGARYCTQGLYRATYDSKMRSLGVPYEQVNEQQLVKRIYNRVSPLDWSAPSESALTIPRGLRQIFQAAVPEPTTHELSVSWLVDGQLAGTGLWFALDSLNLAPGLHAVEVRVEDLTDKVRHDPQAALLESREWILEVVAATHCGLGGELVLLLPPLLWLGSRRRSSSG